MKDSICLPIDSVTRVFLGWSAILAVCLQEQMNIPETDIKFEISSIFRTDIVLMTNKGETQGNCLFLGPTYVIEDVCAICKKEGVPYTIQKSDLLLEI